MNEDREISANLFAAYLKRSLGKIVDDFCEQMIKDSPPTTDGCEVYCKQRWMAKYQEWAVKNGGHEKLLNDFIKEC